MRIVDLGAAPAGSPGGCTPSCRRAKRSASIDRSGCWRAPAKRATLAGLRFEAGSIEAFHAEAAFDLVFSNAAFHWVEDHPALIARLQAALAPGGQLVFQIPASHDAPSHRVAEEVADLEPFSSALNGWRRPQPVLTPADYASLLFRNGFAEQQTRLSSTLTCSNLATRWSSG